MVLNAPLSVRMSDGSTDRHVTKYASALSFTKVASGGHQSCQFRVNLPRDTFRDLGPQDKCWIYGPTGRTIFGAAYLENPTPVDGLGGQSFDIRAMGGMALASDQSRPLIYVTNDPGVFEKAPEAAADSTVEVGPYIFNPAAAQRIRTQFSSGALAATDAIAAADCYLFERAGMNLGGVRIGSFYSGKNDSEWTDEFAYPGGYLGALAMETAGSGYELYVDDHFPEGTVRFQLRIHRTGGPTNVADDQTWTDWADFSATGQRVDRYGVGLLGGPGLISAQTVLASQVAEDLLGRLLTFCDPVTAQLDATTYALDQLAYPDGAKAETILTGLAEFEPDHWWGIGASGETGLHDFWYREWATEPRYVVSVQDGWRQTGSDSDLCNRIVVYYTDSAGNQQPVEVTADDLGLVGIGLPVDALGSRIKDADPITLPAGRGSAANAFQIGSAVLRDKINPPLAGTLKVRRPIMDLLTGNEVMPWELEPGWPVLVREPGYTIRCTEMTYDDQAVASTLTLGRPVLTESQRIAKLARVA